MACFVRSFPLHCEGALFYIKNVCKFLCFCCCVFQNEFYNLIWFQNENLKQSDSSRSCGIPHVLWDCFFSVWMLCCIGCTWKASPQSGSSCGAAGHQIRGNIQSYNRHYFESSTTLWVKVRNISKKTNELDLSYVNFEIFTALVALERFHPRVRPNLALKMTRRSASVVTLVTLERLFSCVVFHHMNFQLSSLNEWRLAHCASVRLFPRVGPFVLLQIAWSNWSIITLVAVMWFLSSVFPNVHSEMGRNIGWIVALVALVRFFPSVNEEVGLQTASLAKWLVAVETIVPLATTVGLLVKFKASFRRKCLGTLVTRLSISHLFLSLPLPGPISWLLWVLLMVMTWRWKTTSGYFPFL